MQTILLGVALAGATISIIQNLKLSGEFRRLEQRIGTIERGFDLMGHRLTLFQTDIRSRSAKLEEIVHVNRGQVKFLAGRVKRIEAFLTERGYQVIAPHRGTSENVSRIDMARSRIPKALPEETPNPPTEKRDNWGRGA